MNSKGGCIKKSRNNSHNSPVMSAAKGALETGNAHHILVWIPEESENTLKNLLERARCERTIRKDAHNHTVDWYFETINRLHSMYYRHHNLSISTKLQEEKAIIYWWKKHARAAILRR